MAIINLNIKSFKKDLGGIANRLVNSAINKVEQKLENAVEDLFAKGLNKVGMSSAVTSDLSSRFGDAFSIGRADDFFRTSTSEQNRVSPREIEQNMLAGSAETTLDAMQKIREKDISSAAVMQFPDQMGQYYMALDFQSYERPSPQMQAVFKRFKTIHLPVPRDLKETFELDVGSKPMGGVAGGLTDMIFDIARGAGTAVQGTEFALAYASIAQALEGSGALGAAVGTGLGQALGAVPNPHLQAIFSGVELRSHSFQWTFAPRNPAESKNLKAIINEIKKNSLPSYSTTGTAALQYPPMVEIALIGFNEPLINFKKCLIKSVSVNYAPAGIPSFFASQPGDKTKYPTMIQLEIQLLETEIQTARDYGLQSGDRPDNLDNFKDMAESQARKIGLGSAIDEAKNTAASFYTGTAIGVAKGVAK